MSIRFIKNRITVNFEEMDGSPEERRTNEWNGDGATRRLKCLMSDRIELEYELLGYTDRKIDISIGGDQNILMHLPQSFGPDREGLIATSVITRPFGKVSASPKDNSFTNYIYSILDVTYEVATRIPSSQYGFVVISEDIRDVSEFVTLPTEGLYWGTGGAKEAIDMLDAPGKINYGLEWAYTISGAYLIPEGIFDYVGQINSFEIPGGASTPFGYVYPIGTLLYTAPVISIENTFMGSRYRISFRFLHKNNGTSGSPKGWNFFPRISASGEDITYERITDGTNNKNFYDYGDFRSIFA